MVMHMMDRREFLGIIGVAVFADSLKAFAASSGPATIMLMRHAEDNGENSFQLSPRGFKRAEALPNLFGSRLPVPQVIIATRATKHSDRPMETVEPLAKRLGLPIDNRFRDDDYPILARDLLTDERYTGKVVLVCWHHGKLAKLARLLGAKEVGKWPDTQFDRVWVLDYKASPKHPKFDEVHERLLDGDH